MKKRFFSFPAILLICLCLSGCQTQQPLCRVVTRVDIACEHDGIPIRRVYTDTKKMEAVLLYMRLLRPKGVPQADPEAVDADVYEITVSLSDGQQHIYRQKAHRYFQEAASLWESIAPEKAAGLYSLMRHYESDL